MFSICPQGREGTYPKVPTPPQSRSGRGRGYPKAPRYLPPIQVRMGGGGIPQGTYPLLPCQGTYPPSRSGGGRGTPRHLPPHPSTYPPSRSGWGEKYPKGPTPHPGQDGGRGYPKVPTPLPCQGTYPHPGQEGEGYPKVPTAHRGQDSIPTGQDRAGGTPRYLSTRRQGTYPPSRSGRGKEGVPKVPTPYPPAKVPAPPPWVGQHMEYLIRCGRYASCVHAGGLSC